MKGFRMWWMNSIDGWIGVAWWMIHAVEQVEERVLGYKIR
jgi:hypothetical protein